MLHTDPTNIPPEWTIMPNFDMGPPQKRRAILWLLAPYDILLPTKTDPALADRFCRFPTACAIENTPTSEKAGESWEVSVSVVEGNEPKTSKR
jgi:hypothetical protein